MPVEARLLVCGDCRRTLRDALGASLQGHP